MPLEKHRNAIFVFASPAFKRLSTKAGCLDRPEAMSSSTVAWGAGWEAAPRTTILSRGIFVLFAAALAVAKLATWVTIRRDSDRVIWWANSSAVYAGLAGLCG